MEIEYMDTRQSFSGYNRTINKTLAGFDLPSLIEKMKVSQKWKDGELNTQVLYNSQGIQIVLTALHEGTEVNSFQTSDSVTFQIVEGKIRFRTRKESVFLNKGQALTLDENIKYSLTTREETVLLLTLVKGTPEHSGILIP
ncbi:MAG: hypothetical protein EHM47_00750 [Ignavibacteriales bacterium]|nr:MAG: hypothetical protein EHM47_00750 [Ignavibacteriales bacterium]